MIIGIDKPAGVSTHASSKDVAHQGSVEYFSRVRGEKLFVCHRLDKETSGALLFATTSDDAAALGSQFEAHEIQKSYVFISDAAKAGRPAKFSVSSLIEKKGGRFVSVPSDAANSHTDFEFISEESGFTLWRARPRTGKPHQIRLHAEASGIAILGDREHNGASFPGLMLLSESIMYRASAAAELITHSVPRSRLMTSLRLCRNQRLASWIIAIEKRERWLRSWTAVIAGFAFGETLRLIHTDGGSLRVEQLGETVALQWFTNDPVIPRDAQADIDALIALMGWKQWHLQLRTDRGRSPENSEVQSNPAPPVRWTAREHFSLFEFRLDSSLSTGLFLDQRANRQWVLENAMGKSILNLFSYTGGFSVAAARGGAKQVVSVDLSKNFIEWSKRNFELNDLTLETHEFRVFDSREFLKIAAKKQRQFDLIICDPPSFSRSDKGLFRIEKDYGSLLTSLRDVLADDGTILFATNFEGWDREAFEALMHKEAHRLELQPESVPPGDWDFSDSRGEPLMKSIFFHKR